MTEEQLDALDDKIATVVDQICRRAGGENDDPPPRWVREAFREAGLSIVPINPLDGTRLWDNS
jgi:hypothetical protein